MADDDAPVANVRDKLVLGPIIGKRVVYVTQKDRDEPGEPYVALHFDNGWMVTFAVGPDGFEIDEP